MGLQRASRPKRLPARYENPTILDS
jgi:hypothetical protein